MAFSSLRYGTADAGAVRSRSALGGRAGLGAAASVGEAFENRTRDGGLRHLYSPVSAKAAQYAGCG